MTEKADLQRRAREGQTLVIELRAETVYQWLRKSGWKDSPDLNAGQPVKVWQSVTSGITANTPSAVALELTWQTSEASEAP